VARFPRIVVLQQGALVGDGSVDVLADACPAFASLFADQLSFARPHSATADLYIADPA
jgi:ABC-type multidrug transport system fused ATPase/permease subunit